MLRGRYSVYSVVVFLVAGLLLVPLCHSYDDDVDLDSPIDGYLDSDDFDEDGTPLEPAGSEYADPSVVVSSLSSSSSAPSSSSSSSSQKIDLEHCVDATGAHFTRRAALLISPVRKSASNKKGGNKGSFAVKVLSQEPITDDLRGALEALAKEGKPYTVRVGSAVASVPAAEVLKASFGDELGMSFARDGSVDAVHYAPKRSFSPGTSSSSSSSSSSKTSWKTSVSTRSSIEGARPALEPVIPAEKRAKEEKNEQGFFRKYWMYIVPGILIMQMLLGPPPEEGKGAPAKK